VVEDLALGIGQPHDFCLNNLLDLHHDHQFSIRHLCLSDFPGGRGHRKYSASIHPPFENGGLLEVVLIKTVGYTLWSKDAQEILRKSHFKLERLPGGYNFEEKYIKGPEGS